MKLREKFRRFWTMDVHNHEGFTLVELIIVIAILAILSGVAVVGYSSYVEKASKQADVTLVNEIKNVLNLAMYSDPFTNPAVGVLVLGTDGVKMISEGVQVEIPEGSELDTVLKDAYGANYRETLKLQYTGWELAAYLNGFTAGDAQFLADSSYLSGGRADMLLSDVEMFTGMAANLAGAMNDTLGGNTLGSLFGDALLNQTAAKYNIEGPAEGQSWDEWGQAHPQEFSNLLVLATAMDTSNMWNDTEGTYTPAASTGLVSTMATYYAFASTCPEFSPVLTQYLEAMNNGTQQDDDGKWYTPITSPKGGTTNVYKVESPSDGAAWYRLLGAEVAKYKNANGKTFDQYCNEADENGDTDAAKDQLVFEYIMVTVNSVPGADLAGDMSNANLFTEGAAKDAYDNVMNVVYALAGGAGDDGLNLEKGQIAIIFNQYTYKVTDTLG